MVSAVQSTPISFLMPSITRDRMQWKFDALRLASWLNTPVCSVRENYYRYQALSGTCFQKRQQVVFGVLGFVFAFVTAPLGVGLRGLISTYESKPFVHVEPGVCGKTLPDNKQISLVSYNVCLMPGGYSITDGGVTPRSDRIDANIQALKRLNPDVMCLFEVEDVCDAAYLSSQLPDYPFIIPVAGARGIGPSSMIYIASKYRINPDSISFVPFVKNTELTGRAVMSEKGVLSFDLYSGQEAEACAHVITTHLQHSEIPSHPEVSEIQSRKIQTHKILRQIQQKVNQACRVIFAGDLNQVEEELESTLKESPKLKLQRDQQIRGIPTWGGDGWCAQLMGKPASKEEVLDYTFVAGPDTAISTRIIPTGYEGTAFKMNALSDHFILLSNITLGRAS